MAFKKSTNIKGNFKNVFIEEGRLIDQETGNEIDLVSIFGDIYEDHVFSISSNYKEDEELD